MNKVDYPPCHAYPPTPNWYTSHAATVAHNYYVYATQKRIVLLDLASLRFMKTFLASTRQITALTVANTICFVAGEDPTIRAFSLLNSQLVATYTTHVKVIKTWSLHEFLIFDILQGACHRHSVRPRWLCSHIR